jgi:GNAT superfamily N-acetyltransferase
MHDNGDLQIRDARPEEYDTMRDLTLAAYAQYATIMPHWEMYRKHSLATLEQDRSAERIIAEQNGTIVGSVLLFPARANVYESASANTGVPEVRLLAVSPAARGLGVGSALLAECERRARSAGACFLGLHTEDLMEAAVCMYERRGYVHMPETDFSPGPGIIVKGYRRSLEDGAS